MQKQPGFLRGKTLMDRHLTFWTISLWKSDTQMHLFRNSGAHKKAMGKLQHWCDEASVVHWLQQDQDLPLWQTASQRMKSEGRPSKVRHPSPHHQDLAFPAPRFPSPTERILLPKFKA